MSAAVSDDDAPLLELCARAAHRAHFRALGLDPPPWDGLRARDRERWKAVAEDAIVTWVLNRPRP